MRVIAGKARGIPLAAPRGTKTRPTADRVREALFSIIQSSIDLDGLMVLDLCAGTGGLGIEALSRGARFCSFAERDRQALNAIRRNLAATGLSEQAAILSRDVISSLHGLIARKDRFDLILFDPPYQSDLYGQVPALVDTGNLLNDNGLLVIEYSVHHPLPPCKGRLVCRDTRIYGDTVLDFYTMGDV